MGARIVGDYGVVQGDGEAEESERAEQAGDFLPELGREDSAEECKNEEKQLHVVVVRALVGFPVQGEMEDNLNKEGEDHEIPRSESIWMVIQH